jgi:hypothetical protein
MSMESFAQARGSGRRRRNARGSEPVQRQLWNEVLRATAPAVRRAVFLRIVRRSLFAADLPDVSNRRADCARHGAGHATLHGVVFQILGRGARSALRSALRKVLPHRDFGGIAG